MNATRPAFEFIICADAPRLLRTRLHEFHLESLRLGSSCLSSANMAFSLLIYDLYRCVAIMILNANLALVCGFGKPYKCLSRNAVAPQPIFAP